MATGTDCDGRPASGLACTKHSSMWRSGLYLAVLALVLTFAAGCPDGGSPTSDDVGTEMDAAVDGGTDADVDSETGDVTCVRACSLGASPVCVEGTEEPIDGESCRQQWVPRSNCARLQVSCRDTGVETDSNADTSPDDGSS